MWLRVREPNGHADPPTGHPRPDAGPGRWASGPARMPGMRRWLRHPPGDGRAPAPRAWRQGEGQQDPTRGRLGGWGRGGRGTSPGRLFHARPRHPGHQQGLHLAAYVRAGQRRQVVLVAQFRQPCPLGFVQCHTATVVRASRCWQPGPTRAHLARVPGASAALWRPGRRPVAPGPHRVAVRGVAAVLGCLTSWDSKAPGRQSRV